MNKQEFKGATFDEALNAAILELGIPSDRIGYEVVRESKKSFFGLFGKDETVIMAWDKTQENEKAEASAEKKEARPERKPERRPERRQEENKAEVRKPEERKPENKPAENRNEARKPEVKKPEAPKAQERPAKPVEKKAPEAEKPVKKAEAPAAAPAPEKEAEESAVKEEKIKTTANDAQHFEDGKAFLKDVFDKMGMEVQIEYRYDEEDNSLEINLSGQEMGVLIGKRGQTLDSLQYLTSLVVNRSGEHYIRVKLDTENYRQRRKETLESLAKNIAYKVRRTRRSVSLEPMNPYERRIIHSALQQDNFVMTKSEGEEPYRHVVVFYRRNRNGEER